MNPMMLLQIKEKIDIFREQHPKMRSFIHVIKDKAIAVGSVIEIKVTSPDGQEYVSNIKVTENDVELIRIITELGG